MKRILLLFVSITFGLEIYSQGKMFVSVDASPIYSYRAYRLMDYSSGNSNVPSGKVLYNYFKKYSDSTESPKFGYQISANLGYLITDKIVIMTGFHLNKIGYKIKKTFPVAHFVISDSIVTPYNDNTQINLYSNLYYFGIPIELQYKVYTISKFNIGLNIGGSINFLIKHVTKDLPNSKENYSEYSKTAIDISAGIQLGYMINEKFEVYLMPHVSDYITSNVKINTTFSNDLFLKINQYNYYGDIKFGLKYKL